MFERLTARSRKVVVRSQEEAQRLGHNYIGTEHLLLGILREDDGVAARALNSLNVTLSEVRRRVESMVGRGEGETGAQAPFTPRSKKVLELALREALQLRHNYIGTEHILLGLLKESDGVAVRILSNLGADPDAVRSEILRMLGGDWARAPRIHDQEIVAGEGTARVDDVRSGTFRARVEGLVVQVRCGATDEERATPQPLRVNLSYLYEAWEGDDLYRTVDYGTVIEEVAKLLEREEFQLLETGAQMVGKHVLGEFPPIRKVTVTITKLRLPIDREVSGVSVEAILYR